MSPIGRLCVLVLILATSQCAQGATDSAKDTTIDGDVRVVDGMVSMVHSDEARTLRIYLPPGYAGSDKRYPVVYMHDAQNLFDRATAYMEEWQVDEQLNRLAASRGLEFIVVGIDHGGAERVNELSPWDHDQHGPGRGKAYVDFIVERVKPWVDTQFRTLREAKQTAIIGSSLGGLATQYAIHQYPQVFSKAGIFSPSFWYAPEVFGHARQSQLTAQHRLYYLAGSEEGGDIPFLTEKMAEQQRQHNQAVIQMRIIEGGAHNEALWRSNFSTALLWLFERH